MKYIITIILCLSACNIALAQKNQQYARRGGGYCFAQTFKSVRDLPAFSEYDSLPDGKWIQVYPSGELAGEYTMKNHNLEGPAKCYYQSGKLRYEFRFHGSYIDGEFKEYYESGILWKKYHYFEGFLDGKWSLYYEDGKLWAEGTHKNEKLDGDYFLYWPNGNPKEQRTYKENKFAGYAAYYYETGIKQAEGELEGDFATKVSNWTYWYENGVKHKEVKYENGIEVVLNAWDRKSQQMVRDGTGRYTLSKPDGSKMMEGSYSGGKQQGKWLILNESTGQFAEVSYLDGLKR